MLLYNNKNNNKVEDCKTSNLNESAVTSIIVRSPTVYIPFNVTFTLPVLESTQYNSEVAFCAILVSISEQLINEVQTATTTAK